MNTDKRVALREVLGIVCKALDGLDRCFSGVTYGEPPLSEALERALDYDFAVESVKTSLWCAQDELHALLGDPLEGEPHV